MIKRYAIHLIHKYQSYPGLTRFLWLLPYLFLVAVLIINIIVWIDGAPWYYSVLTSW
ncbi:hypothetical protein HUW51_00830 (plasmid) [Adhaeribacter swui]|uniref:Uncharacterized protein n=1 Tax=Adhaeribacter swui TaxID=2086471 RepID=A0A7G7G2F0_9BACT|nr:hypothetical protein [Adhaeribacter swui]QNF31334.1 hypothetical protein HUW51_00830 [Adhaeribacter swui]